MKAYIELNNNIVCAYATYNVNGEFIEVEQEDSIIDFNKLQGYYIVFEDEVNKLKFDESKYQAYLDKQKKQQAIQESEKLANELANQSILDNATDDQAFIMRYLYPEWSGESISYKKNDRFMYQDKFYKVLQNHTSQTDWIPNTASSLYVEIADPAEEWPEFKQPTGAHDAYVKDAKVTFEGKHYISLIDANVYSPTAYPAGWSLVE